MIIFLQCLENMEKAHNYDVRVHAYKMVRLCNNVGKKAEKYTATIQSNLFMRVYTGIIAILSFLLILFITSTIVKIDPGNAAAIVSSSSSFQQNEKLKTFE